MPGHVLPNSQIAVDIWQRKDIQEATLFFLSHAHTDHMKGLTSTWKDVIYTSPITAKIIINKLKIQKQLVKILEVNESHLIPLNIHEETITVTLLDANHCPGAVIFIFQGYFGTIVYTGDFRYSPEQVTEIQKVCRSGIDILYLDNTFCHPLYEFPCKRNCLEEIIKIIKEHENHNIKIGLRSLGKEELLTAIALRLKTWIHVDDEKYNILQLLDLPNVFTTNENCAYISVVPFNSITGKQIRLWNDQHPTVVIIPTALFVNSHPQPFSTFNNVYNVPYSDHSSYSELKLFVKELQPNSIQPVISDSDMSRLPIHDMSVFKEFLNFEKSSPLVKLHPGKHAQIKRLPNFMNMHQPVVQTFKKKVKRKHHQSRQKPTKGVTYCSSLIDCDSSLSSEKSECIIKNDLSIHSKVGNQYDHTDMICQADPAILDNREKLIMNTNLASVALTRDLMPTVIRNDVSFLTRFYFNDVKPLWAKGFTPRNASHCPEKFLKSNDDSFAVNNLDDKSMQLCLANQEIFDNYNNYSFLNEINFSGLKDASLKLKSFIVKAPFLNSDYTIKHLLKLFRSQLNFKSAIKFDQDNNSDAELSSRQNKINLLGGKTLQVANKIVDLKKNSSYSLVNNISSEISNSVGLKERDVQNLCASNKNHLDLDNSTPSSTIFSPSSELWNVTEQLSTKSISEKTVNLTTWTDPQSKQTPIIINAKTSQNITKDFTCTSKTNRGQISGFSNSASKLGVRFQENSSSKPVNDTFKIEVVHTHNVNTSIFVRKYPKERCCSNMNQKQVRNRPLKENNAFVTELSFPDSNFLKQHNTDFKMNKTSEIKVDKMLHVRRTQIRKRKPELQGGKTILNLNKRQKTNHQKRIEFQTTINKFNQRF